MLIAYFSEPVGDLQPGDIQIRRVTDNKLTTVENVIMSSDGLTATLQLVGYASQNVVGLNANTEYRMIVSTDEGTAEKVFTIPGIMAEATVTAVDSSKNQIKLWNTLFTLGDDIEVDFNEILGRTVTVEYDKNLTIHEFTLLDEVVLYGAFKKDGDDIKDQATGDKYPISYTYVGSIYDTFENNLDEQGALVDGNDVDYAKVVLNGNGSVRSIISITNFENVVYVAGVSGTDLLNVKGTATTLKDYNIIKDGLTIAIDDIEEGDVVFIDTTKKNAEVYNDSVEGKMTVYTGKIDVDGTRYDTKGDLVADGKDGVATDANLKNYNGSNVELFFARTGDIAKIVVTDAIVNSSNKFVVLTEDAKLSVSGTTQTLEFKAGDGDEVKTYSVDVSKLTSVVGSLGQFATKGEKAKNAVGTESTENVTGLAIAATTYDAATLDGDIIAKDKDGEMAGYKMIDVGTDLVKGTLVQVTTTDAGVITGLALSEKLDPDDDLDAYTNIFGTASASGKVFKAGYNKIGDGTAGSHATALLPTTTPVLVYYPDSKEVKAYEYADVDFTFTVDSTADGSVRYDGNKAAAIVINAKEAGIAAAEVNKKHAVIVGTTFDQSNPKKLVDLTVAYGTDSKVVYKELANDILVTSLGGGATTPAYWAPGTYVEIEETKADGKLAKVTTAAKTGTLANYTGQDKSEFVINGTYKMITADDAGVPTTITTLSADGKTVKAISWSEYCDYDKTKVASVDVWTYAPGYVDVMVVNLAGTAVVAPAGITFTSDKGNVIADGDNYLASAASTKLTAAIAGLPDGVTVDSVQWYYKENAAAAAEKVTGVTGTGTSKILTLGNVTNSATPTADNTVYYVVVTGSDEIEYTSPTVTLKTPVATSVALTTAGAGTDYIPP